MELEIFTDNIYGFETFYSYRKLTNGLLVIDYPKEDNKHKIEFMAAPPGFDLVSSALEEATFINHITGKPFIRTSILYRYIFLNVIKHVNFTDNFEMESFSTNCLDLSKINYNLVKIICKAWLKEVL